MPKILFVIGSLREKSFNRQLAREAERIIADRAEVSYLDYADIPFMNQDIEFPAPESIARVRAEVQAADALWIFTAEYNYQIPGMLKNLLDWLSRPLVKNDWSSGSAAGGKIATISGAGGKFATAGVPAAAPRSADDSVADVLGVVSKTMVFTPDTAFTCAGASFSTFSSVAAVKLVGRSNPSAVLSNGRSKAEIKKTKTSVPIPRNRKKLAPGR